MQATVKEANIPCVVLHFYFSDLRDDSITPFLISDLRNLFQWFHHKLQNMNQLGREA